MSHLESSKIPSSLSFELEAHPQHPVVVEVIAEPGVQLPAYATQGAAGLDVRAHIDKAMILESGAVLLIPTGLSVAIPSGYEIQVRPRSGMALKHQVIPLNTPGTIDSDYRGQLQIILANLGKSSFTIEPGMRIAQLVLARHECLEWKPVDQLIETKRGVHGFGGTGVI